MDRGYVTIAQAQRVVDELLPHLNSIGLIRKGETFLFREMDQPVDYLRVINQGIVITLSTNAMLPDFIGLAS